MFLPSTFVYKLSILNLKKNNNNTCKNVAM